MFGGINDKSIFITQILTHIHIHPTGDNYQNTHLLYCHFIFGKIETVINLKKNVKIVNDKFYGQ